MFLLQAAARTPDGYWERIREGFSDPLAMLFLAGGGLMVWALWKVLRSDP